MGDRRETGGKAEESELPLGSAEGRKKGPGWGVRRCASASPYFCHGLSVSLSFPICTMRRVGICAGSVSGSRNSCGKNERGQGQTLPVTQGGMTLQGKSGSLSGRSPSETPGPAERTRPGPPRRAGSTSITSQ